MMNVQLLHDPGLNFQGFYGLVHVDKKKQRAIKIFKNQEGLTQKHPEAHIRDVFQSEINAYQIAMKHPEVKHLVPTYYGNVTIGNLLDANGENITSRILTDCAYEMEYIPGYFEKLDKLKRHSKKQYKDIIKLFKNAGIPYIEDSSYTMDPNGKVLKIVDFGIESI